MHLSHIFIISDVISYRCRQFISPYPLIRVDGHPINSTAHFKPVLKHKASMDKRVASVCYAEQRAVS